MVRGNQFQAQAGPRALALRAVLICTLCLALAAAGIEMSRGLKSDPGVGSARALGSGCAGAL